MIATETSKIDGTWRKMQMGMRLLRDNYRGVQRGR